MVYGKVADIKPKKNPKEAFYYSLIPGGGQSYNKKFKKALVIISIEILAYRAWKIIFTFIKITKMINIR